VSELLGSFSDNELSPECLDGAQRLLKPGGISIPASYTSFLAPITSCKMQEAVRTYKVGGGVSVCGEVWVGVGGLCVWGWGWGGGRWAGCLLKGALRLLGNQCL
jgi:hypothetical protein